MDGAMRRRVIPMGEAQSDDILAADLKRDWHTFMDALVQLRPGLLTAAASPACLVSERLR